MNYPTSFTGTLNGVFIWNGTPVIDDDDGGTAGVREPRTPFPSAPPPAAASAALPLTPELTCASA